MTEKGIPEVLAPAGDMERLEAAKAETAVAAAETTVENTEETKAAA